MENVVDLDDIEPSNKIKINIYFSDELLYVIKILMIGNKQSL